MWSTTRLICVFNSAIAFTVSNSKSDIHNRRSAAYPASHRNRISGAIARAGTTLHAPIFVREYRFLIVHMKYAVRADFFASPATDATLRSIMQLCSIFQIFHAITIP